ncbi:hypothetical protein C8J56DRAFT_189131 [Mycena floridula]|nr:hypothetical protein C8J56DRAFT_189131 [Mycena floridula]
MGPFGQPSASNNLAISGAMSFNPQMHGSFSTHSQMSVDGETYMELSDATAIKLAQLQAKLNQRLGPEYLSQRPGPGGGPKLTYVEGWKVINIANEVFGFNGWSSSIVNLTTDFIDFNEESRRYTIGVTAIIRVTLRDGIFHEDIGYGMLENSKSKGAALDKCKKEAVTDGLKRCLRQFGNLLGNCLYDKSYTQEVVKIKVPPPKFEKHELYRRPEFEEPKPQTAQPSTTSVQSSSSSLAGPSRATSHNPVIKSEPLKPQPAKPLSSIPSHVQSAGPAAATPSNRGKMPAGPNLGLNTPITTPIQQIPLANQPRRVAFAPEPPVAEPDPAEESFSFYSDDDAILAAVDLAETDIGRPIDYDEGPSRLDESTDMSTASIPPNNASRSNTSAPRDHSNRVSQILEAQQQSQQRQLSNLRPSWSNENSNPLVRNDAPNLAGQSSDVKPSMFKRPNTPSAESLAAGEPENCTRSDTRRLESCSREQEEGRCTTT